MVYVETVSKEQGRISECLDYCNENPGNGRKYITNEMTIKRRQTMKLRTNYLVFKTFIIGLLFIGLLGVLGCGGDGGSSGALYIMAEVNKGDDSYTPPSDVTSATFVGTSMDVISNGVTDASVTIKDTSASYLMFGGYFTQGEPSINEGEDVDITVIRGENTMTSSLPMPEKPGITAPADDSWHDANSTIDVQWNALSTTPDLIIVDIMDSYTLSSDDYTVQLSDSATSHSIPAGTLLAGISGIEIDVYSVNMTTTFTGAVLTGSFYAVSHQARVEINTNP